jgi:hypothetical protein
MKQSHRNDYIKRLKQMRNKDEDADRFLNNNKKGIDESPTSMKMKNTFILVNNNPSFDNYAAMMKKRKMGQTQAFQLNSGNSVHGGSNHNSSKKIGDEPMSGTHAEEEDETALKINQMNPSARDGHASIIFDNKMVIFGGDRHHMPFNDLFLLDLKDYFFSEDV